MTEEEQSPEVNAEPEHQLVVPDEMVAEFNKAVEEMASASQVILQEPEARQMLLAHCRRKVLSPLTKHLKVVPAILYFSFFEDLKREDMAGHALFEALYGVLEEREVHGVDYAAISSADIEEQAQQIVEVMQEHADAFVHNIPTATCFLGVQRLLHHHCPCQNCTINRKVARHLLSNDDPDKVVDIIMAEYDLGKDKDYVTAMGNPILRTMQILQAIKVSTSVQDPDTTSLYIGCTTLSMRGWNFMIMSGMDVDVDRITSSYKECGCAACQWHLDFLRIGEEEDHTLTEVLRMAKMARDQGIFVGEHEESWEIFSQAIALHEKYVGPV